jgi:outer membrane receptor protein involved in Fe transport
MSRTHVVTYLLCSAASVSYASGAAAQDRLAVADPQPVAGASAQTASGQNVAMNTINNSGDIIVTAQKRSERLSEVPLSISAASGDQLRTLGVTSAGDLAKVVTGFSFTQSTLGAPIYTIRGIGFYDDAIGIAPTVTVYIDQVPLAYSRMAEGATLDVERIEALKGPQGTLFGQNSTGGAINYIAAKPTEQLHYGGNATVGRFGEADIEGYISGPLTDTLRARVAIRSEQRGDYLKSETRPGNDSLGTYGANQDTMGKHNFITGRVLLDWNPVNTLRFELNVNGWRDRSDNPAPQFLEYSPITPTPPNGTGYTGSVAQPNLDADLQAFKWPGKNNRIVDWDPGESLRRNDRFYQAALRGDLDLTDAITLTSISAYSKLKVHSPAEADGTPYLDLTGTVIGGIRSISQELRVAGNAVDHRLKWTVGGNYQDDKIEDSQLIHFDGTNTGIGPYRYSYIVNESNQRVKSKAGFGSLDFDLTRKLTAYASVRYTSLHRTFDGCLRDAGDGIFGIGFGYLSNMLNGDPTVPGPNDPSYIGPGQCATFDANNLPVDNVHKETNEHNVSWRVGSSWKFVPGSMIYANITRGYKSGNFGTLPLLNESQAASVPQEQLTAYEIGLKSALFDRKLDLTLAAFYYDYKNKQLLGTIDTGQIFGNLPAEISIPKSRVEGVEASVAVRPVEGLSLSFGGTYINSKITGDFFTSAPVSGYGLFNIKGESFTNTPKWSFTTDGEYQFPVGAIKGFVGGTVSYRSSTTSAFAAEVAGKAFDLPEYALVDARFGVESVDAKWRAQFWIRNLTNKYYWTHAGRIQDTITRQLGMPRTFGITVSTKF